MEERSKNGMKTQEFAHEGLPHAPLRTGECFPLPHAHLVPHECAYALFCGLKSLFACFPSWNGGKRPSFLLLNPK